MFERKKRRKLHGKSLERDFFLAVCLKITKKKTA